MNPREIYIVLVCGLITALVLLALLTDRGGRA